MRQLSSVAAILLVVLLGGGAAWYVSQHPVDLATLPFVAPCSAPLPYTVGSIDPRFGLSKEEIVTQLAKAAQVWNDAAGKPVLAYAPDDPNAMPVNFVYDQRQQSISVGQKIDSTEASQQEARAAITKEQTAYQAAQEAYAAKVAQFNQDSKAYADEVAQVNARGGADQKTYARLQTTQQELKARQEALRQEGEALDARGRELSSRIAAYNASVRQINQVVQAFNSAVGGEFEEGQYVRETDGSTHIEVYAYKEKGELLHTLSHEFGHALGIGHNENPSSIMFPYNKSGVTLSAEDIAGLTTACKLK